MGNGMMHVGIVPVLERLDRMGRTMDRQSSELAIQRLRQDRKKLQGLIEDWRAELHAAREDVSSASSKMTACSILIALAVAGLLIALFVEPLRSALCCVLLPAGAVCVPSGILLAVQWSNLAGYRRAVTASARKLNDLYDRLEQCEKELASHERVVRG